MARFGGSLRHAEEHAHIGTVDVVTCFAGVFATCLALLRLHLPWLRRIYVLTRSPQIPDCLAPDEIVVHHDALGLGQTFNSHAIEASLHRIPGLSEHFLYCNDDFYVRRPVSRRAFFSTEPPSV